MGSLQNDIEKRSEAIESGIVELQNLHESLLVKTAELTELYNNHILFKVINTYLAKNRN